MKVPFSWLKQYVDIDVTAQELEGKLFDCGFEVEELIDLGGEISKVVVGVVTECVPQEGTHLHICKVDCGDYGHDIQISTGAANVYAGMHTPAALDGSTLPGGIKIKAKPLMGIESNGMLCSGTELGLNDDLYPGAEVYGLLDLPKDTVPGTPIQDVVGLDDYIFDISITANRADCQSVLGIAREVAAVLGKPLKMPATDYTVSDTTEPRLSITVEAPDLCPRYIGHYVHNITPGESPRWMRRRLALCGLRSISNVVDITNYVMLEIGQPMHAFDMDTLESCQIIVRRAKDGEKITTLDEKEFTLTPNNLVICDGTKPVALAGVMGGLNSEIKDGTTQLLFESAKFARDNIRKTARGLGQNTDASSHYEKGISEYATELGMARALHLIQELGCGEVSATHFDCSAGAAREGKHFTAKISRINAILGITVPTDAILDILNRLQFAVTLEADGDTMQVTAPRWREDIEVGEPDLAEEVIREYGYEHIKPTFLKAAQVTTGGLTAEQKAHDKTKRTMCAQGFYEAETLAFYADADLDMLHIAADAPERKVIRIVNPISSNLTIMRSLLAPSLLNAVVDNLKKGNAEGPGIAAYILCKGERVGVFGKLANDVTGELKLPKDSRSNQNIYLGEIDWVAFHALVPAAIHYAPIPALAPVQRDLALVAPESTECGTLIDEMQRACKQLSKVELFDIYRGEKLGADKKSMAFSLYFQPTDAPFAADEVDRFVKKILGNLKFKLGIEIRE